MSQRLRSEPPELGWVLLGLSFLASQMGTVQVTSSPGWWDHELTSHTSRVQVCSRSTKTRERLLTIPAKWVFFWPWLSPIIWDPWVAAVTGRVSEATFSTLAAPWNPPWALKNANAPAQHRNSQIRIFGGGTQAPVLFKSVQVISVCSQSGETPP